MKACRDYYFKRAKYDGYPARSVYKLKELDTRFRLLAPGQRVLDLGAAPGSWSLYAASKVGWSKAVEEIDVCGHVLAVDIQDWSAIGTTFPNNVTCFTEDVLKPSQAFIVAMDAWSPFELVLSDMAPRTTGVRIIDQARSLNLAEAALRIACSKLVPYGHFVAKVFMGPDVNVFIALLRRQFASVKTYKPMSSRRESFEVFYIGLGFLGRCGEGCAEYPFL